MVSYPTTLILWLIAIATVLFWPVVLLAEDRTDSVIESAIYPLTTWQVSTQHGEDIGGLYHMGIDAGHDSGAGAPVYAMSDGVVREAQERTQFGLVVLIEHFPDTGSPYVSLYGHLDPTQIMVEPGETVTMGQQVGVLGTTENNGGWTPHIHFGIHKSPYSGEWVYYGHVQDVATAEDWFDPETFISERLTSDRWSPTIATDLIDGAIVGNTMTLTVSARDIGSTVKTVKYRISGDSGATWTTVATQSAPSDYDEVTVPLYAYADGDIQLKIVARDYFNNKAETILTVTKDPYRSSLPAFVAVKGSKSDAFATQWSFAGTALQAFFPFQTDWEQGGDIAVGDVLGLGEEQLVIAKGTPQQATVIKVMSVSGQLLERFSPFARGTPRVATADTAGDGSAEIIVGSGKRQPATVAAFTANGASLWSLEPFGDFARQGLDVTAADLDGMSGDEVIAATRSGDATAVAIITSDGSTITEQFYPFKRSFTGGVNVTAGDVTGDGVADVIVGSESDRTGSVRVFNALGEKILSGFKPFGLDFIGAVDVATTQWDTLEDDVTEEELIVSQASDGQAWVKVYRLSGAEPEIVFEKRIYEDDFIGGARIAGYR